MALYLTKLVNGQVQKLRVSPTKAIYRGYWAVIVGGFAGTSVTCNGVTKFIGSNERVAFNIITPGTYTFTATRQGTTITKEVVLNDDTQEHIINLSMFIGMQQLEYIESTGTQWIDTGIIPDENTNVKVKASYVEIIPSSQYDSVVGSTAGGADRRFYPLGYTFSTGKIRQTYGSAQYEQTFDTNIHTVDFNNANKQVVVDGTVVGSTTSGFVKSENQPSLYLFATNVLGTPDWYGAVRLYSLQIYDNGTLVRDFIPIKDDTNHGALYDKVTQQIFYNSGTGEFIPGPAYVELEYIESNGTQWIDTKVHNAGGNIIDATLKPLSNGGYLYYYVGTVGSTPDDSRNLINISRNAGTNYYRFQKMSIVQDSNVPVTDRIVNIKIDTTGTDLLGYIDGTLKVNRSNVGTLGTPSRNICIGKDEYSGQNISQQIYDIKIYDNTGTLVRDLIPMKIGTEVGMYDKVTDTFFTNAGTGEFIAGPDKQ